MLKQGGLRGPTEGGVRTGGERDGGTIRELEQEKWDKKEQLYRRIRKSNKNRRGKRSKRRRKRGNKMRRIGKRS